MPTVAVPLDKDNCTFWPSTLVMVKTANGEPSFTVTSFTVTGASLSNGVVVLSTGVPSGFTPTTGSVAVVAGLSGAVAKITPVPSSLMVPVPTSLRPDEVVAVSVKVSLTSSGVSCTMATRTSKGAGSPGVASPSVGMVTKLPGV